MKAIGFVSGMALGMAAAVQRFIPTFPSVQSATRSISGAA